METTFNIYNSKTAETEAISVMKLMEDIKVLNNTLDANRGQYSNKEYSTDQIKLIIYDLNLQGLKYLEFDEDINLMGILERYTYKHLEDLNEAMGQTVVNHWLEIERRAKQLEVLQQVKTLPNEANEIDIYNLNKYMKLMQLVKNTKLNLDRQNYLLRSANLKDSITKEISDIKERQQGIFREIEAGGYEVEFQDLDQKELCKQHSQYLYDNESILLYSFGEFEALDLFFKKTNQDGSTRTEDDVLSEIMRELRYDITALPNGELLGTVTHWSHESPLYQNCYEDQDHSDILDMLVEESDENVDHYINEGLIYSGFEY